MNYFTRKSIEIANDPNYLDQLYDVYPIGDKTERKIDKQLLEKVEYYYKTKKSIELFKTLLKLPKFPIDDQYVGFFRKDSKAIDNNPKQVQRICDELFKMDIDELLKLCKQPKKPNRQLGESFKKWINKGTLGFPLVSVNEFESDYMSNNDDVILVGSDKQFKKFAQKHLGYNRDKGLDFISRINGKYVIGEAKFISSEGGSQNTQFLDANTTLNESCNKDVISINIVDGVIYIPSKCKNYKTITENNILVMSVFVLKEFLHSL